MFNYARPEVLVDTEWLADHLGDPGVRLVEGDISSANYDAGHIPGAVFWNVLDTIVLPDRRTNLDKSSFEALLSRSGISGDTTIVLYADIPSIAPWTLWFLKLFGHRDVRILNGGRKKWLAEGRALSQVGPAVEPAHYVAAAPDPNLDVELESVKRALGRREYALVDVRTQKEYDGELFLYDPPQGAERAGHIPGAIHVYYETAVRDDGTFKPAAELQALYEGKGITPDKTVITYCTFGGRASHTWFVLKYLLGYLDVRNYAAGWLDWSRQADTPVESRVSAS